MGGACHAGGGAAYVDELGELVDEVHEDEGVLRDDSGGNCMKIGVLHGKLILSKRKGLWEVVFS